MHGSRSSERSAGTPGATARSGAPLLVPGKRTLTEGLAVQRRVQRASAAPASEDPGQVHAAAARGTATPATPLPHAERIQRAFGRHDISRIQAHVGGAATASAVAMGARAYATGDHVVLGDQVDLHTVAHEAAHVVQQRGTVQLKGGVGQVGDAYEQHADAVADQVVRGGSAEALLDAFGGGSGGGGAQPVQRAILAHAQSDQALKQLFDELCQRVDSIGALTDQIGNPVRIRYGSDEDTGGRRACFEINTNTIIINQALQGDLPGISHYILIELNHARLGQAPVAAPQPRDAHTRDQEELGLFTAANDALRVEYHEWISAYLTHMETADANMTMSGDGPDAVTPRLAPAYTEPEVGFFNFEDYMDMQIRSGHTAAYDPAATDGEWVGHILIQQAQQDHAALLVITEEQHLQNALLLIRHPATLITNLTARANPFSGAMGTNLLDQTVPQQGL